MKIEDLHIVVGKLDRILQKPEPGLFTWHEAVHGLIRQIAEGCGYDLVPKQGSNADSGDHHASCQAR